MDAKHRHELKSNELAEGLSHLPQLIKDNVRFIIGILLIAAAFITWPMFNKMADQKASAEDMVATQSIEMLDQDIISFLQAPADDPQAQNEALETLLVNADALMTSASNIDNPNLAAMARIKAAQAIRTELNLRKEVDAEMLERQIQKATDAYQNAFETAEIPTIKGLAQFGLGLCSEELGQTEQAAEIYQQIVDDESYKATVLPAQAQSRLDNLADNSEAFTFAAAPAPTDNMPSEISELLNSETPQEAASTEEPAESTDIEQLVEEAAAPQSE